MWVRIIALCLALSGCVERQNLGVLPVSPDAQSAPDAAALDATALDVAALDADTDAGFDDDAAVQRLDAGFADDAAPLDAPGEDATAPDSGAEDATAIGRPDARGSGDAGSVPNANRLIGYPCVASNQCLNGLGLCLPEDPFFDFVDGYCSADCSVRPCPSDALCVRSMGAPDLCFDQCDKNADCRVGYGCVDEQSSGICVPQNPVLCRYDVDCQAAGRPHCDKPSGRCVECLSDADCSGSDVCLSSVCQGSARNGTPCQSGADCLGRSCQPTTYAPGGYCTQNCVSDLDCSAGGHCGRLGECLADCTSPADCRPGYRCLDGDGDFLRECRATGTGTGTVGAPCASVTDCQGGLSAVCLSGAAIGPSYPLGYCSAYCPTGSCPAGSSCQALGLASYCMADCGADADCRQPDYQCLAMPGQSFCYPR